MKHLSTLLALAVAPSVGFAQQTVEVDFESGTLGWVGPFGSTGQSAIVPGGGNGGGAGYEVDFSDFFITIRNNQNPVFLGDYTQFDSVTLSTDIQVDQIDFFFGAVSRPWLVELRSYDLAQGGYPWTSVWFKFADISAANQGDWTTFSVTIDDTSSATLPTGWRGYGDEDPQTFEPILPAGVTFADVLADVDEIAFTTGEPGFFFGQTDFLITLDNMSIETTGGPWSDLGSGLAGVAGEPKLFAAGATAPGAPGTLALIDAAPSAVAFLAVGLSDVSLPFYGGTLVPSSELVITGATAANGTQFFPFTWPALPGGTELYWQQWIIDPSGPFGLAGSNALRSTTP